jgi:hypothetical protein
VKFLVNRPERAGAEDLAGLPLALEQAVAYITRTEDGLLLMRRWPSTSRSSAIRGRGRLVKQPAVILGEQAILATQNLPEAWPSRAVCCTTRELCPIGRIQGALAALTTAATWSTDQAERNMTRGWREVRHITQRTRRDRGLPATAGPAD